MNKMTNVPTLRTLHESGVMSILVDRGFLAYIHLASDKPPRSLGAVPAAEAVGQLTLAGLAGRRRVGVVGNVAPTLDINMRLGKLGSDQEKLKLG